MIDWMIGLFSSVDVSSLFVLSGDITCHTLHFFVAPSVVPLFCCVSLQELRLEDYQAGRKGPTNPIAAGTGGLFSSATPTSSATTGLFGSSAPNASFSFGQNKSTFGASEWWRQEKLVIYLIQIEESLHSETSPDSVSDVLYSLFYISTENETCWLELDGQHAACSSSPHSYRRFWCDHRRSVWSAEPAGSRQSLQAVRPDHHHAEHRLLFRQHQHYGTGQHQQHGENPLTLSTSILLAWVYKASEKQFSWVFINLGDGWRLFSASSGFVREHSSVSVWRIVWHISDQHRHWLWGGHRAVRTNQHWIWKRWHTGEYSHNNININNNTVI